MSGIVFRRETEGVLREAEEGWGGRRHRMSLFELRSTGRFMGIFLRENVKGVTKGG